MAANFVAAIRLILMCCWLQAAVDAASIIGLICSIW